MYELSRVRLHSVGPKPARYQDVLLDLSGVGNPVIRPGQDALFGDDEPNGPARRPSPATVLFAENGNGKSVLIKLIFSVMLPDKRDIVGTTSTKALDAFVLPDDVAHVALEWQHAETGDRVVTGKVSAWRSGSAVADGPAEAWYSFRPRGGLTLETLPVSQDGRRVLMPAFRDRLNEAGKNDPALQLVWETGHGAWKAHLESLGLDPKLFQQQGRMNAGEGEAAEAFPFKNDEQFVDWLLGQVGDPDDAKDVTDLVSQHARRLAERDGLIAEREFVSGAVERLVPLSEAAEAAEEAARAERAARRAADGFRLAVGARHAREQQAAQDAQAEQQAADDLAARTDQQRRRANETVHALRRATAQLRWDAAQRAQDQAEQDKDAAQADVAAWAATETVVRYQEAKAAADAARAVVGEQEQQAEPVLAARQRAAQRLARGLLASASYARDEAARNKTEADAAARDAQAADDARDAAARRAERAAERASVAETENAAARRAVEDAVARGLLGAGEPVALAAERAEKAAEHAARAVAESLTVLGQSREARRVAEAEARAADDAAAAAEAAAATAADRLAAARVREAELAEQPRLAELLGADAVVPEQDASALREALSDAIRAADEETVTLRVQDRDAARVLDALGSGGLLPPGDDVTAAVAALEGAGITAYAGWTFLSEAVSAADRDRVLSAHPDLVGGIVVNDAADLDRAHAVLSGALLLPRSVVAVGTTGQIVDADGTGRFVVPPNPAMYDEDRAEDERQRIDAERASRADRLVALDAQTRHDRRLQSLVAGWARDFPAGTTAALEDAARATLAAAEDLSSAAVRARAAADLAADEEDAAASRIDGLREQESLTRAKAQSLAALARQDAAAAGHAETTRTARADAARAEREAADAAVEAARNRSLAADLLRKHDDETRTADTLTEEIRGVSGGASVDGSDPVPAETVETLRAEYRAADAQYAQVQVGADLRASLHAAETAEADRRIALESLLPDVRDTARELLLTPDGSNAPSRKAAASQAERRLKYLSDRYYDAVQETGRLKNDFERLPAPDRSALDAHGVPTTVAQAEEFLTRAETDHDRHRQAAADAADRKAAADKAAAAAASAEDGFRNVLLALGDVPTADQTAGAEPFDGTVQDAAARRDDYRASQTAAEKTAAAAEQASRAAADKVAQYAADRRFEKVDSVVRQTILDESRETLPSRAEEWTAALRPRLRTLDDDLAQIDKHRQLIVARLQGLVDAALRTLRTAQRVSKLPAEMGDWSGQEFLRISFADPDPAALAERLGALVDDAAAHTSDKRDGKALLLRGVKEAMRPKGVKVDMLKPDAVLRTERVRVGQIADVFSGGQHLTAAILLYCTLAALRANERGQTRQKHAGVLFLDNPIGRASAAYLLELQFRVARQLGVQLVYTTGLYDLTALKTFPLIVRLRNDSDLRAGLKYLSVEQEIRNGLPDDTARPDTGHIDAARLFTRPQPAA